MGTSDFIGAGSMVVINSSGNSTFTMGSLGALSVVLFVRRFEGSLFFFLFFTNSLRYERDLDSSVSVGIGVSIVCLR